MARRKKYRPYRVRRSSSRRNRMILITFLVVIAGIVILIQSRKNQQQAQASQPEIPSVSLEEVLPANEPIAAEPAIQVPQPQPEEPAAQPLPESDTASSGETEEVAPAGDAVETSPEARELIDQAIEARKAGKIIASRDLLNDALKYPLSEAIREEVKNQLSKLAERWLFSRDVLVDDTLTEIYVVRPGNMLANIGDKFKVPYQILMEINGIARPELLQAGQKIKVINGPFNAVVYRNTFTMDLYLQDKYIKTYRVGLGLSDRQTPTGLWQVKPGDKLIKPTWTDPDTGRRYIADDPDYPLGSRWIGLKGLEGNAKGRTGFAIHGTKDPETIGTQSSKGCIRLYNGDVIEVYNLLFAGQSLVNVTD